MVRPKTKERRGHRTYHGKHKNHRGGGTRGGRGDVGKCKHHFMRSMLLGTQMGQHGFVRLPLTPMSRPLTWAYWTRWQGRRAVLSSPG